MRDSSGFYDTNVLVAYLFREEGRFDRARDVLRRHVVKALSIISIHELHMYSVRFNVEDRFIQVKEKLHNLFKIIPLTQSVCIKASYFRRNYSLPEIDSLILASAVSSKCKHFYTFDRDFEKLHSRVVEGVKVHYLGR